MARKAKPPSIAPEASADKGIWVVKWLDAVAVGSWCDAREIDPQTCFSVGRVIVDDGTKITIAGTWSDEDVNCVMTIPATWVLSKERLF